MSADAGDSTRAQAAELAIKEATTEGVTGLCEATVTPAQYAPDDTPTLGRDVNRAIAVGIFEAMRALPLRLPSYTVVSLPPAASNLGSLALCTDGANGKPILAYCDGAKWLRSDDHTEVVVS